MGRYGVEVAMRCHGNRARDWLKSSFCGSGGECVEVALLAEGVAVRDGKNPTGPTLRFTSAEWLAFLAGARIGEFDPS